MEKTKATEKKTITLRKNIVAELVKRADEENRNFSNMVETAAIEYLKSKNEHVSMI